MNTKNSIKLAAVSSAILLLSSCSYMGKYWHTDNPNPAPPHNLKYDQHGRPFYGNRRSSNPRRYASPGPISEPKPSFHFADRKSPKKHKERDLSWVKKQSPQNYTIEVARDKKASTVANALHQSPKTTRSAQIKVKSGEQSSYSGVYGSYKNRQEAEKALSKLPSKVRQSARIKQWGNVQSQSKPSAKKSTTLFNDSQLGTIE